jgi:hypothetical protein
LPAHPGSPVEALAALRSALASKSFAALLAVLSRASAQSVERERASLVEGLEEAGTLEIERRGDRAIVEVPGGHVVRLRLENGAWRVEDFE